jgi:hypothetical protein
MSLSWERAMGDERAVLQAVHQLGREEVQEVKAWLSGRWQGKWEQKTLWGALKKRERELSGVKESLNDRYTQRAYLEKRLREDAARRPGGQ